MFDPTNSNDRDTLRDELLLDPTGIGYNIGSGNTRRIVQGLNDPDRNTEVVMGVSKLTAEDLLQTALPLDLTAKVQGKVTWVLGLAEGSSEDVSQYRLALRNLNIELKTGIDLLVRPLNRIEVLFSNLDANGVNETIMLSKSDWFLIRGSI